MNLIGLTEQDGLRIAEVGFALGAIAGAFLIVGSVARFGSRAGNVVAGLALAAGSVLLIIAVHWGHFY